MEFFVIIIGIIALVVGYFFLGILLKFIFGWFPSLVAVSILIPSIIYGGWLGGGAGVVIVILAVALNDSWHNSERYLKIERFLDKKFYFDD